jgi:hypothetical protein
VRANARAFFLAVGFRVGADRDRMRAVFDEGVAAAGRAHDDRLLAQLQLGYIVNIGTAGGQWDEAAELATDCLQTARRSGDLDVGALVQGLAAYFYVMAGRFREGLAAAEAALELTADHPDRGAGVMLESPRGTAMVQRVMALAALGHPVEALVVVDEAEAFLRGRGFKETLSWLRYFSLFALRTAGPEVGEAQVAFAREALVIAEAISGPYARAVSQTALATA